MVLNVLKLSSNDKWLDKWKNSVLINPADFMPNLLAIIAFLVFFTVANSSIAVLSLVLMIFKFCLVNMSSVIYELLFDSSEIWLFFKSITMFLLINADNSVLLINAKEISLLIQYDTKWENTLDSFISIQIGENFNHIFILRYLGESM